MKKILFVLIIFICGCSKEMNLNIDNIQSISYDNIDLIESDFESIKNEIKRLNFKKKNVDDITGKVLKIVTNDDIYNFNIFENNVYYKDTDIYISSNKNLIKKLDDIKKKYTDTSYFKVKYNNCDNANIKIDNSSKCLILETSKVLYNFKINSVMMIEDYLEETALLYEKEEMKNNKIAIRVNIINKANIKVSFDNEYGYNISVLPIYNEEEDKLNLNLINTPKK